MFALCFVNFGVKNLNIIYFQETQQQSFAYALRASLPLFFSALRPTTHICDAPPHSHPSIHSCGGTYNPETISNFRGMNSFSFFPLLQVFFFFFSISFCLFLTFSVDFLSLLLLLNLFRPEKQPGK